MVINYPGGMKCCPIEATFEKIGKKWAINILRDLFMGKTQFSDFLKSNPSLSSKVLAQRLKELTDSHLLKKTITSKTPIRVEYTLTKKGHALNKVLYEIIMFSVNNESTKVIGKLVNKKKCEEMAKVLLGITK